MTKKKTPKECKHGVPKNALYGCASCTFGSKYTVPTPSKARKLLSDFALYCDENPGMRFWQALLSWAGGKTNLALDGEDTFYWEKKNESSDNS